MSLDALDAFEAVEGEDEAVGSGGGLEEDFVAEFEGEALAGGFDGHEMGSCYVWGEGRG